MTNLSCSLMPAWHSVYYPVPDYDFGRRLVLVVAQPTDPVHIPDLPTETKDKTLVKFGSL